MDAARGFDLIVAIDLQGGRVVRLEQGDFARQTVYSDDPVAVASAFAGQGVGWLHVVDLDAARTGEPAQHAAIAGIVERVGNSAKVEVAGGLRNAAAVEGALAGGASRAVIGSAAIADPSFAGGLVRIHGSDRIAVAIDVRDGRAIGHGWSSDTSGHDAIDSVARLAAEGVTTFEVTAIDRDGLLGGPDLDLYRRVVALGPGAVIASGGIGSIDDLRAVRDVGCSGAIVGRALYAGRLDLTAALRFAAEGA